MENQKHTVFELIDEAWEECPKEYPHHVQASNVAKISPKQLAEIAALQDAEFLNLLRESELEKMRWARSFNKGMNYGLMGGAALICVGGGYYLLTGLGAGIVIGATAAGEVLGKLLVYGVAALAVLLVFLSIDIGGSEESQTAQNQIHHHHHYNQYNNTNHG